MIITRQKDLTAILGSVGDAKAVFLIGCGECATTCKTGGEADLLRFKEAFEKTGRIVSGMVVPSAPCIAAKVKLELARNRKAIEASDAVIVFACGLGVQSVKDNARTEKPVYAGCDTHFMGVIDSGGNFRERCSACGECVLDETGGICPITRCAKSLMNGPCGGQDHGKCEVDKNRDCAWIQIYDGLKKAGRTDRLRLIGRPRDHRKSAKPRGMEKV